jgi:hypothetical protein
VVDELRAATTPEVVGLIAAAVDAALQEGLGTTARTPKQLAALLASLRAQAENLVAFIASGDSTTVRARLLEVEQQMAAAQAELAAAQNRPPVLPARVRHTWLLAKLGGLRELLGKEPAQAKTEIARHLDGPLTLRALPASAGEDGWEITGAAKTEGLLGDQGTLCLAAAGGEPAGPLQYIAGAR